MTSHKKLLNSIARWFIVGLRPLLGPALCYHEVGCSSYAVNCLEKESFLGAVVLIIKRVFSCNPISARIRLSKKTSVFVFFLLFSLPQTALPRTTEDISVNECNPESLRSKELLLQLISTIKETCKLINGQNPKISATAQGLSVICEIDEPRTYIILVAENALNALHCSINTNQLTKKQKGLIEKTMIRLFCTKSS
jgi:putative component of membrane protein insertase Oxa1/YidC/SpoIIIJ protein YidD